MATRTEIYSRLRYEKGMTYEEIGEIFGVTRQAVHDALNRKRGDGFQESTIRKIKYIGLRNWMLENRVKLCDLGRRCGNISMKTLTTSSCNLTKKTIDAILGATGLTYEECFKEDEQDDRN